MHRFLRCVIVLSLADSIMINMRAMSTLVESFENNELVPDLVSKAPSALMTIRYPSGVEVLEGNVLTPTQVKDAPTVCTWDASPDDYYTIMMAGLDAPSHEHHKFQEWNHWVVVNILGNKIETGETISDYVGSGPPEGSGLHRYVFVAYKQPGKLVFDEPHLSLTAGFARLGYTIAMLAEKYNLGDPVAGNIFFSEFDDWVPILYRQVGIIE